MSVEKLARRSLWRMTWWRFVGDIVGLIRMLAWAVMTFFVTVEKTVYTLECDAARRYRAITGADLGVATGEPSRYSGVTAAAIEQRDQLFEQNRRRMISGEDEE